MQLPDSKLRSVTIDGDIYHVKLLEGRVGWRTMKDIATLLLPLIGESVDANRHDDVLHGAPDTFRQLALLLCEQTNKIDVEDLIFDRLLGFVTKNNGAVKIEDLIIGNYGLLIELVVFALKENFGSTFAGKDLITRSLGALMAINNQI